MKRTIAQLFLLATILGFSPCFAGSWSADRLEIKNISSTLSGSYVYIRSGVFPACDKAINNDIYGVLYVPNNVMLANLMWAREAGKYVQLQVSTDYGSTYDVTWRTTTTCLLGYMDIDP